jgi:hypothetical protein
MDSDCRRKGAVSSSVPSCSTALLHSWHSSERQAFRANCTVALRAGIRLGRCGMISTFRAVSGRSIWSGCVLRSEMTQTEAGGRPEENAGDRDHNEENPHVEEGLAPVGGLTAASAEGVEDASKELREKEKQRDDTDEGPDSRPPSCLESPGRVTGMPGVSRAHGFGFICPGTELLLRGIPGHRIRGGCC